MGRQTVETSLADVAGLDYFAGYPRSWLHI
jgi:hypothetical protein